MLNLRMISRGSGLACLLIAGMLLTSAPRGARAEDASASKSVNLALFAPIQIVPREQSVEGFRFSLLYGHNYNVEGLDLSLVGINDGDFKGVQLAVAGVSHGNFNGLQWAPISWVENDMEGVQLGFFNGARNEKWLQLGAVNYAETAEGLQFAIVNWAESLNGLQLGFLNFAKNGFLPVFPIVNFHFED